MAQLTIKTCYLLLDCFDDPDFAGELDIAWAAFKRTATKQEVIEMQSIFEKAINLYK